MNENVNYVNPSNTSPAPEPQPLPARTWRDLAAPALALALSALFWAVFSPAGMARGAYGPGLGVPALVLAYFAALFIMLGPRWDGFSLFYMAISVCLALCCALYAHAGFTVVNCFIILLTAAAATFRLSGQSVRAPLSLSSLAETAQLSIFALFSRISPPLRILRRRERDSQKAARIAAAVLVSVGLLAVVLTLLASADMVFASFFSGLGEWFKRLTPGRVIWRLIRTVGLALFILSGLYFIRTEAPDAPREPAARERQILPYLLPAVALDAVYILFCAVQLRYLFGGAEAASMAGGWAEYARTGFFQLVAVAAINLTLCAVGSDQKRFAGKGGLALRIADAALLALTAVILLSAARRMQLYIGAFGMSVLRLTTLWGMAAAAVGILLAGWKLYRPNAQFFPAFFGFALVSWCVFCLMNPAGRVARYNADAYLDGRLAAVDTDYLAALTPDAARALDILENSGYDPAGIGKIRMEWAETENSGWTNWKASLSDLH